MPVSLLRMWCGCAIVLFCTSLSAQNLRTSWYDISFAEFHQRYAFSEFDHALIDVFAAHHRSAYRIEQVGGAISTGGMGVLLIGSEWIKNPKNTLLGLFVTGGGVAVSVLGHLDKISYSKKHLYLYLHEERKIPDSIQKQIPIPPTDPASSLGVPAKV